MRSEHGIVSDGSAWDADRQPRLAGEAQHPVAPAPIRSPRRERLRAPARRKAKPPQPILPALTGHTIPRPHPARRRALLLSSCVVLGAALWSPAARARDISTSVGTQILNDGETLNILDTGRVAGEPRAGVSVDLSAAGINTVINTGMILRGNVPSNQLFRGIELHSGLVENRGVINAGDYRDPSGHPGLASAGVWFGSEGTVRNAGTIEGGTAILFEGDGAVTGTLTATGEVTAVRGVIRALGGSRGSGIFIGDWRQAGRTQGRLLQDLSIAAGAQIIGRAGGLGIAVGNLNNQTISNSGSISGVGQWVGGVWYDGSAIRIGQGSGAIINNLGGWINSGDGWLGGSSRDSKLDVAISVSNLNSDPDQTITVDNAGTIRGGQGIFIPNNGVLTNRATLVGASPVLGHIEASDGDAIFIGRLVGPLENSGSIRAVNRVPPEQQFAGAVRIGDLNGQTIRNAGSIFAAGTPSAANGGATGSFTLAWVQRSSISGIHIAAGSGMVVNDSTGHITDSQLNLPDGSGGNFIATMTAGIHVAHSAPPDAQVTIQNAGTIIAFNTAILFEGDGGHVTGVGGGGITGLIRGNNGIFVGDWRGWDNRAQGKLLSNLTIAAGGQVIGLDGGALRIGDLNGRTITNNGLIYAAATSFSSNFNGGVVIGQGSGTIINASVIDSNPPVTCVPGIGCPDPAGRHGISILNLDGSASQQVTVMNSGLIRGRIVGVYFAGNGAITGIADSTTNPDGLFTGTISSTQGRGIWVESELLLDLRIGATGTISGNTSAIDIGTLTGRTIENAGRVIGSTRVLRADEGARIDNLATGFMRGITLGHSSAASPQIPTVTNAGTITTIGADTRVYIENAGSIGGNTGLGNYAVRVSPQLGGTIVNQADGILQSVPSIAGIGSFRHFWFGIAISAGTQISAPPVVAGTEDVTVDNWGTIDGKVAFARGNDTYIHRAMSVQNGLVANVRVRTEGLVVNTINGGVNSSLRRVDGGGGTNTYIYEVPTRAVFNSNDLIRFQNLRKTGAGTLVFDPAEFRAIDQSIINITTIQWIEDYEEAIDGFTGMALGTERIEIQGGTFENRGTIDAQTPVSSFHTELYQDGVFAPNARPQADVTLLLEGDQTVFLNAAGAVTHAPVTAGVGDLRQTVSNFGRIAATVALGDGPDSYILWQTGTQDGVADGGGGGTDPATRNTLRIETAPTHRTLAAGTFVNFQTINLNQQADSTGTLTLGAAASPATAASLDTGGISGTTATLHRGGLALADTNSSLRAETVTLAAGTRLSGNGTIFNGAGSNIGASGGTTTAAGTIAPGNSAGHLTFDGNLTLTSTSLLDFEFGAVDVVGGPLNDLITVTGDLVLDGDIRVTETPGGAFTGPGIYRVASYGGALIDNTLEIQGALPNGLVGSIQTTVPGQINLVILGSGATTQYWDGPNTTANGVVDGGTEFWRAATTNWTTATGTPNDVWSGGLAVFQAAPGVPSPRVVTVETGYTPAFQGLQFSVGGYLIQNSALRPGTGAFVAVSGAFDAQIDSVIEGTGSLNKQGIGRLILTGDNSYSGGTTITAGTLAVGHDRALGTGAVTLSNGTTLQAFADGLVVANAMTLSGATGAIDTQAFDLRIDSLIGGGGTLDKQGTGRLILTGANSYTGGTTITAGTVAVGDDSALGTGAVTLRDGTTLQAFGADRMLANAIRLAGITGTLDTQAFRLTLTGDLEVQDTLRKLGSGALVLEAPQPALPEIILSTVNLVQGTLENARRLALSQGVAMGPGTTLDNRLSAEITTGARSTPGLILGDAGAQTVINAGTIVATVALGAGDDRYELRNFAVQTGRVDGGAGHDTAAFRVDTGNTRTIEGNQFFNFELLEKSGEGTLRLIPGSDSLATATLRILGGRVENMTSVNVTDQVNLEASNITWANMAGSSVTATAADPVAIRATAAQVTVDNGGAVSGEVRLTGTGNTYILATTGTQTGQVHAGDAATSNRLQIDAPTTGAGRSITQASFVHFGQIDLNQATNATGRIVLAAAPAGQMTLDTGAMAGSRATLHRGELVLTDQGSSLRAETVELQPDTVLRGNGTISTTPDGGGSLGMIHARGVVAPGNSIGTLDFVGNYTPTGPYQVEYRPPPLGTARGRNMAEGSTLVDQDADLIRVTGTATLTGGTIVPIRLGTAAEMNTALAAQGAGGTLRWLVLRAQGGLGGTRFVALSNVAEVSVEYPANGTDVELVLASPVTDGGGGDDRPPTLLPSAPPPSLPARDGTLRQWGLSQNGVLFDLAADCDRPIGLSAAARDESWCSFGQGRLLTASGEGSDGLSVYGGAWAQSGLGQSRLRVADAATGVMRRVGDEAWLGLAVGYGRGWSDFGGAGGDAFKTSFNALQLAGLGRWARGSLELRGMLGYGWSEVESRRPSGLRGGDPRLVADYDLQQATAAGEARWWFGTRGARAVAPTLRLTGARQWRGGYSEEGTSADRFTAERATWDSLRMALGMTGEIGTSLAGTPLVVEPRLGWVRELGDRAVTVTGTYAGTPGEVMSGRGGAAARDSAVVGLAGIAQLTGSTRLRLGYDGAWYEAGSSHSVTMRLSYAW